jgi:hypothetical protein
MRVRRVAFSFVVVVQFIGTAVILLPRIQAFVRATVVDFAIRLVRKSARDMHTQTLLRVARESEEFIAAKMGMARSYPDKYALLDASLAAVDPELNGIYCEFGVYQGATINHIASRVKTATVYGFDSFEGLPEDWRPGLEKEAFATKRLPRVHPNVTLYKGWFKDTLPIFKKTHPEPLAFAHLDADLYVSTKEVLDALADHIVPGTVLQFDEFLNYPGWQEGESKAFLEFCQARSAEVEYLGYVATDEQVAVRIKKIAPVWAEERP